VVEGLAFAPDQGLFEREDPEGFYSADWNGATLPNDDFVFETVYVAPWTGDARLAVTELPFQSYLADINDQADTFGPVIAALRAFDEGRRQFPAAADWVEQHA
jgi:hypothetical protein